MLTSVYDNAKPEANMYIVIGIAQLSLSAVLKMRKNKNFCQTKNT